MNHDKKDKERTCYPIKVKAKKYEIWKSAKILSGLS
jgi:hypothetical protein